MRGPGFSLLILLLISPATPAAVVPASPPETPSEDEKALRAAHVSTDGPGLLAYFRKRTLTAAQRARLRERIPRLGHDEFAVRQQASLDLMALGPAALPHLRAARNDPDEEIKERLRAIVGGLRKEAGPAVSGAAARLLRARAPAGAVEVLLAYLPDADEDDVAEEVIGTLALLGVREDKVTAALVEALAKEEPARRAAAAAVLGRSGTTEQRATVRSLLKDKRPLVRFRAAQGLFASRDRSAIPTLIALLTEGTAAQAARADELLACAAGTGAPRVLFDDTPVARRVCRAAWASWWRFNARIDLARADVDLPALNATIRCRQTARMFLTAFFQGDQETLRKLVGMPFLLGGERVFLQAADLEKHVENLNLWRRGPRNADAAVPAFALRSRDSGIRIGSAMEQTFLKRFRRGEVHIIEATFPPALPGAAAESITLLVRLSGQQAHVVGFNLDKFSAVMMEFR